MKKKIKNKIKKSKILKRNILKILNIVESNTTSHLLYFYLGRIQAFGGNHQKAIELYKNAIASNGKKWKYYYRLSKSLAAQKKWWQVIEPAKQGVALHDKNIDLYLLLGKALEQMNQFDNAIPVYQKVILLESNKATYYYRLGFVNEKAGNITEANYGYEKVIALDNIYNSKELGIGIFHEKKGLWIDALKAYKEKVKLEPKNALLHYKIGFSYDRTYDWKNAQKYMEYALNLDSTNADIFYRLGFVYERDKNYEEAEKSYKTALEKEEELKPYWYYRLGYILNKQEKHKEASEVFLLYGKAENFDKEINSEKLGIIYNENHDDENTEKSLKDAISIDTTNANLFYRLGFLYERRKKWEEAEKSYKNALERQDKFTPDLYYRLGYVLNKQDKNQEANKAFLEQRILQDAHGVAEDSFNKNKNFNQVATYAEYFKKNDLLKNSIMYESYGGVGMSCNPYAMFLDILEDERFQDWKHIWVIDDHSKIPEKYRKLKNIFLTTKNSDLYLRYLSSCEYLINNSTFPSYFIRKPNQKYLNTWHGTPLKTLGIDIKDSPYQRANTARNFLHTTHIITPNQHTTNVLINRYGINGVFDGKVAETGYPRIDLVLNNSDDNKKQIIQMMGLDPKKPIVLYAPTYRGLWDTPEMETNKMLSDLKELGSDKYNLIFRGHYFAEKKIKELNLPVLLAPHSIDSCELLSVVDVLITDYSSIFYDFLPTDRPLIHYVYDYDEYSETRGMYFEIDVLPGHVCHTVEDVLGVLDEVMAGHKGISNNYNLAKEKFSLHEDGKSTKRTIEFFFFDKIEDKYLVKNRSNKKSLLFYASPFDPNGITSAIINLTNNINKDKYNITIVIDRISLVSNTVHIEQLNRLDKDVNILVRSGRMVTTVEEQWTREKFGFYNKLVNEEIYNIYKKAHEREFTRIFGYHNFHTIVDFHGYRPFWASIFAFGTSKNKSIYLHNDMHKEYLLRFPYLKGTFNLYKYFDKLISVSESVSESNRSLLSENYSIPKDSFYFCNNPINLNEYEELSNEVLSSSEYRSFIDDNRKKFINIARLSPEKGQLKLIEAFVKLLENNKNIALYIMGTGPLYEILENTIDSHQAQNNIILLGHQSNPYPYIKNSDCMVLSSEHEGQGIVLLEALFFGIPCISTDIPGPRSVLNNGYGILVGDSTEDLTQAMQDFLKGKYIFKSFDPIKYNNESLDMFYQKVCNEKR